MISLDPQVVQNLPVDQLGLEVLHDFYESKGWNDHSYLMEAKQQGRYRDDALRAIAEAWAWLRNRGLVAVDPDQQSPNAVTRLGVQVIEQGPAIVHATDRLQLDLHSAVERVARPQFLIGAYEQGVFASMKAVEVRVRKLAGLSKEAIGVDLMNKAFGPTGPLVDSSASKGEQEGARALFAGAYAVLRNPAGHHEVNNDDVIEAAEGYSDCHPPNADSRPDRTAPDELTLPA